MSPCRHSHFRKTPCARHTYMSLDEEGEICLDRDGATCMRLHHRCVHQNSHEAAGGVSSACERLA